MHPFLRAVLEIDAHHPFPATGKGEGVAESGVRGDHESQPGLHDAQHLLEFRGRRRDRAGPLRHPRRVKGRRPHALLPEERQNGRVVWQFDRPPAIEGSAQGASDGDGVGGKGRPPPRQAVQPTRLHEEGRAPLLIERGHHRLAVTVAPGAADPVQGHAIAEQNGVSRPRPRQPMIEVAAALPDVGQGRGEAHGHA